MKEEIRPEDRRIVSELLETWYMWVLSVGLIELSFRLVNTRDLYASKGYSNLRFISNVETVLHPSDVAIVLWGDRRETDKEYYKRTRKMKRERPVKPSEKIK